jgi:hypothetical protein
MALRRTAVAYQHADCASHPHAPAGHRHLHGLADPAIVTTARGMWALKWSCVGLLATAGFQLILVVLSGSVALLVVATLKQQHRNILDYLTVAYQAALCGKPAPSLLPHLPRLNRSCVLPSSSTIATTAYVFPMTT